MFTNIIALWARRLSGVPCRLVITEHNTLSSVVKSKNDLRWQVYPKLAEWFYPWADTVIAVSTDVANDLTRTAKVPQNLVKVVYNPIVTPDLQEKSEAPLDHPWFKDGEPPVVLSVGRLTDQKAFDVLIQAFSRVRKNCLARLLILGEGENRLCSSIFDQSTWAGTRCEFDGICTKSLSLYGTRFIVCASFQMGRIAHCFGRSLYLRTPIVATDCPGGSREILKDGQFGKLVPVDEPLVLAEAIEGSMNDRRRLYPPVESWQPFNLDFVVDRYIELLLGV